MLKPLSVALTTLLAIYTSACDRNAPPVIPTAASTSSPEAGAPLRGKAAYEQACGRCHDRGLDGAPRTGDHAAWVERSALWEAVLYEHATHGYLDMPAMGGSRDLDDREVKEAAEYMLSLTHPELPPDPR